MTCRARLAPLRCAGGRCEGYSSVGRGSDEDQLNIRDQRRCEVVVVTGHASGGGGIGVVCS